MTTAKKLALIAGGYALSAAGGIAAAAVNEMLIPADISQTSGGMVAFGDMIVFVLGTGFFSLVPTWFLLKLLVEEAPRALLAALLLLAAIGPLGWLAVIALAGTRPPNPPLAAHEWLGPLIAFGAIPRIVAGPVLLVVEGATFLLAKERLTRVFLAAAMLLDIVPLGLYTLHFASIAYR